jgi:hypothetical protein
VWGQLNMPEGVQGGSGKASVKVMQMSHRRKLLLLLLW